MACLPAYLVSWSRFQELAEEGAVAEDEGPVHCTTAASTLGFRLFQPYAGEPAHMSKLTKVSTCAQLPDMLAASTVKAHACTCKLPPVGCLYDKVTERLGLVSNICSRLNVVHPLPLWGGPCRLLNHDVDKSYCIVYILFVSGKAGN